MFALEIQMYGETKNNKKLRVRSCTLAARTADAGRAQEIYEKSLRVRSAIPHPRIQGVIRECGGKMYMSESMCGSLSTAVLIRAQRIGRKRRSTFSSRSSRTTRRGLRSVSRSSSISCSRTCSWTAASTPLTRRRRNRACLSRPLSPVSLTLACRYKNDPEIVAMTNLVSAYQRRDVHEAEKILRDNRATIMDDPFIRGYIDDVLRSLRTQWILEIIKPYTRIEISYLARVRPSLHRVAPLTLTQQLRIPSAEVEDILVALILDTKILGSIDQVTQRLELDAQYVPPPSYFGPRLTDDSKPLETRRYAALDKWTDQLVSLQDVMITKSNSAGQSARGESMGGMSMGGWGGEMFA